MSPLGLFVYLYIFTMMQIFSLFGLVLFNHNNKPLVYSSIQLKTIFLNEYSSLKFKFYPFSFSVDF